MTDVKLPDGSIARFPDGTPPEVMKAAIQKKFPPQQNVSGSPDDRSLPPPSNPVADYASQGISGFNEGLANIAGFPVDAVTLGMNAGSAGINKLFGTDLPQINNPALGSEQIKQMISPTIAPPSKDQGQQIVRRIGQELGATALPGMGPAMRSLTPLKTLGAELLTATGSGLGAGVAEQVAPDNPVAEFGGQVLGGLTVGGGLRALEKDTARAVAPKVAAEVPTPTVDELRDVKNAAYKAVDDKGVRYTGDAYKRFMDGLTSDALNQNISEKRHSAALDLINQMDTSASKRNGISMGALDDLRQEAYRDLVGSSNGGDRHFGQVIVDHINDFIDNAAPADLMGGKDPKDAANAILFARGANSRYRKAETLATAIRNADLQASASGSGGNINNALRQQFKQILTNPKKSRGFTKDELAGMEDLVRQGKAEDFLRWVGKAAPGGNGLVGALEILGTVHNPALAVMPVAGMIAKGIADKGTLTKAANLQRKVALGPDAIPALAPRAPAPSLKSLSPDERARINAWLLSGAANQTPLAREPVQITVRGGASR